MPNTSVSIDIKATPSFEEVGARFKKINIPVASQEGLQAFAFMVERGAKMQSPVDTGRLRASIATDIGNLRATVAPHTNYALFVHEGTKYMAARPFLAWGYQEAEAQLTGKNPFVAAIKEQISRNL